MHACMSFSWWLQNKNPFSSHRRVEQSRLWAFRTPTLAFCLRGLKEWAGFGALVPLILTWFIFFSYSPFPPSSSSVSTSCTTQCLSTEISYSLTQTKNLAVRRESISKVLCPPVSLRLPPSSSTPPPPPPPLHFRLLINQVMHCISPSLQTPCETSY